MSVDTRTVAPAAPQRAARRSTLRGVLIMLGSATGNQIGAGLGAHAFGAIGPAGVVAVRQFVAAAVLLPMARPRFWRFSWGQWWPSLGLGLVFAMMNLTLYVSIDRIGLGLAVTLEFLGPLAVALFTSRSRLDALVAVGAAVGVLVLVWPGPTTDYVGIAFALVAAGCWATYILLNRMLGARLAGLQGPAVGTLFSVLLYLPVLAILVAQNRFTPAATGYAICAGLLCSALPYAADLVVLRRVSAQFFGVFMSVNPVLAALAGIVVLGQLLSLREWLGVLAVVAANAVAVVRARRRPDDVNGP
jgi:inner membrane transporter RhtA